MIAMHSSFDIKQSGLNNFDQKANEVITRYYLTPYPKKPIKNHYQPCPSKPNLRDGHLERVYHGGMHASRVANYVDHFQHLYSKHDGHFSENFNALAQSLSTDSNSLLQLTKYAAIFHDSGRQDEDKDYWDKQSAENCRRYLREHHVPEHLLQLVGAAAQFKGQPFEFKKVVEAINRKYHLNISTAHADYIRRLISSSDTLDVMRVRTKFEVNYLDIYQNLGHIPEARADIIEMCRAAARVIQKESDACMKCDIYENGEKRCAGTNVNFSYSKKVNYEHSSDPYGKIKQDLITEGFHLNNIQDTVNDDYLYALALQNKEIEAAKYYVPAVVNQFKNQMLARKKEDRYDDRGDYKNNKYYRYD